MPEETRTSSTRFLRIHDARYAWLEPIDVRRVARRHAAALAGKGIDALALVLAGASILGLILSLWVAGIGRVTIASRPSSVGLWLSFSAFFGCFLMFRAMEASTRKKRMPKPGLSETLPVMETAGAPGTFENIAPFYHASALKTVESAVELAKKYGHARVEPLHLFVGSMTTQDVAAIFARLGLSFEQVRDPLIRRLQTRQLGPEPRLAPESEEVLLSAFSNAYLSARQSVHALELCFEAYKRDTFVRELLFDLSVDEEQMANVVEWIRIDGKMRERYEAFRHAATFKPTGPMNRSMTSLATPLLDSVSEDLTTAAVKGLLPLLVGREEELASLFRAIEGGRQSVVLVGPPGVGKAAIIGGVAQLMVEERVPAILQDKRLVELSLTHVLSGVAENQAEARLLQVLTDVARARNVILAIPDLEQILLQGAGLAGILVDFLSRGATFAIATTTNEAYAREVEQSLLGRAFQKLSVEEPSEKLAIQILESNMSSIENEFDVLFSYDAVEKAVELSGRYLHESYLPEKALLLCREAGLLVSKVSGDARFVTGEDVASVVAERTHIPLTNVQAQEKDILLHLEEKMHERMVGQEEAVTSVASALRRARANIRSKDRPIATFLFLGPTGVGKTELAKTIAQTYFGSEENMHRFDMSEYQESRSISRLIGDPSAQTSGSLTEAIRQKPFSIVLLDELEKAHPDVLNLFLQVFDDGRLTDASGRTIDFTDTIIIATSNAGSEYIQQAVRQGESVEQMKTALLENELRGLFRPEFLNRFDGVIVFKPLTLSEVEQIAYLMINQVSRRLEPKGIYFRASDEAVLELAKKGFDPVFGARPLRRVIQEEVDNAVAQALLEGKAGRRDTIVLQPGGLIEIEKAAAL